MRTYVRTVDYRDYRTHIRAVVIVVVVVVVVIVVVIVVTSIHTLLFRENLTPIILNVSDVYRATHPHDAECGLLARWLDRALAAAQQHGLLSRSAWQGCLALPSCVVADCLYRMSRQRLF